MLLVLLAAGGKHAAHLPGELAGLTVVLGLDIVPGLLALVPALLLPRLVRPWPALQGTLVLAVSCMACAARLQDADADASPLHLPAPPLP